MGMMMVHCHIETGHGGAQGECATDPLASAREQGRAPGRVLAMGLRHRLFTLAAECVAQTASVETAHFNAVQHGKAAEKNSDNKNRDHGQINSVADAFRLAVPARQGKGETQGFSGPPLPCACFGQNPARSVTP